MNGFANSSYEAAVVESQVMDGRFLHVTNS